MKRLLSLLPYLLFVLAVWLLVSSFSPALERMNELNQKQIEGAK
jgi:hypothetical protein